MVEVFQQKIRARPLDFHLGDNDAADSDSDADNGINDHHNIPIDVTTFSPTGSSSEVIRSSSDNMIVRNMTWTDHAGIAGRYTGWVNALMQPHGRGVLIYKKNGTATTCVWTDGTPTKAWSPIVEHEPDERKKRYSKRKSSSARCDTCLPHLDLGDAASPQDIHSRTSDVIISSLQKHDFAFILRSDKRWTYAIVADRQVDRIVFVVHTMGRTKVLSRRSWSDSIRPVNNCRRKEEDNLAIRSSPESTFQSELKDEMSSPDGLPYLPYKLQHGGKKILPCPDGLSRLPFEL